VNRSNWNLKVKVANAIGPVYVLSDRQRAALLRACGVGLGPGTTVKAGCTFEGGPQISIGRNCFIGAESFIEAAGAEITIGDHVFVAHRVNILTATHEIGARGQRATTPQLRRPVVVHDGCWLGTGVIVLPGVTIGAGCVIAAGAVVTSDCEADGLYAGIPASRKRDLP
jgi:maltose O-acetyltransferase